MFGISDFGSRVSRVCLCLILAACATARAAAPETPPTPVAGAVAPAPGAEKALAILPPFGAAPLPWRFSALWPVPIRPWFPPATLPLSPRLLPSERQAPIPQRRLADRPDPLGPSPGPPAPLRSGAPAYASAPESSSTREALLGPIPASSVALSRAWLPPAGAAQSPRRLPSDGQKALYPRPAVDLPTVASWPTSLALVPPRMLLEALAYASALDPLRVPMQSAAFLPVAERPSVAADPTLDVSRQASLTLVTWLRQAPAPFLRLTIPDPFEAVAVVQLRTLLPDSDPPALAPTLPARRTFAATP